MPQLSHQELATAIKKCTGVAVQPPALAADPDLTFAQLGVDSLGVLGVITELENRYGIRLGIDAEQCARPQQLITLVRDAEEVTDARAH